MEQIQIELLKCGESYKKIDKEGRLKYKKSVNQYGQLRPILINSNLEVIDGKILYQLLKELGYKKVWILKINVVNEIQFYTEYNLLSFDIPVVQALKNFSKSNLNDNCYLYSKEQLERYVALLSFDWNNYKKKVGKTRGWLPER